jgi:DNA-directed RNA polymerase specialized sigma24 family protein
VELLELLAVRHQDWVAMVRSFGCPQHLCEDLVQEMYLRMHRLVDTPEKIRYGEADVNTFFVYVTLRNMYHDYLRVRDKVQTIDLDSIREPLSDDDPSEKEQAYANMIGALKREMDTWHWYDNRLFTIYATSGKSMRTLQEETRISISSIFNTIKNGKQRIHESEVRALYEAWKTASDESPRSR